MYTIIRNTKSISDVVAAIADDATKLTLAKAAKTAGITGVELNYVAMAVKDMSAEMVYNGRTIEFAGQDGKLACRAALDNTTDALNRLLARVSDTPWPRDIKLAYMRGLTDYADVWRQLIGDLAEGSTTTYACKSVNIK